MTALWKNIQGTRKVVAEMLLVSILTTIVYLVAYLINGKKEETTAVVVVLLLLFAATIVAVALFSVTLLAATLLAATTVVIALSVTTSTLGTLVVLFIAAFFFTPVAAGVAEEHKVGYWKVSAIYYVIQGFALFGAMRFAVPYLAIGVLAAMCLGVAFLFAESKLRLWLAINEPPESAVEEERVLIGSGAYRSFEKITAHSCAEPFRLRLHRRLHRLYIG